MAREDELEAQVRALTEALDWAESQLEKAQVKAAAAQIVAETQAEKLDGLRRAEDVWRQNQAYDADRANRAEAQLTKQAAVIEALEDELLSLKDWNAWCEKHADLSTETRDKPIHIEANPYMAVEHSETGEHSHGEGWVHSHDMKHTETACPNDHGYVEHWTEDTYGREIRLQCDCDCAACSEY
jgi:hypothetical protein